MIPPLLAEMISGDSSVSLSLVIGLATLIGGSVATALVTRAMHGWTLKHLRKDLDDEVERGKGLEERLQRLEIWKVEFDTEAKVRASASQTRGTQPYSHR